jgi:hypothetical protein
MAFALVTLAALASGCHDPANFDLAGPSANAILSLSIETASLPADGTSRTKVRARVAAATDPANLELTFTTTAGTLIAGAKQGSPVTARVDSTGEAIVELRSGDTPASAIVEVSVAGITRRDTVEFVAVPVENLFTVSLSAATLPADGFSVSRIDVQLHRTGLSPSERQITVEVTAGTLLGSATPQRALLTADNDGAASAFLQSAGAVGTATVTVTWSGSSRRIDIPFVPANPLDTIRLTASRSEAPADGATGVTFTATISSGLPSGRRSVTFRTDRGTFGGSPSVTLEADRGNDVSANLTSTIAGGALVTATVDGTSVQRTVVFNRAFPDGVSISADSGIIASGGATPVRTQLRREVGTPSTGLAFTYTAVTSTGASIGSFSRITTNTSPLEATATFELGTTAYLGPVTIRVTAEGGATATTQIIVQ